jgi:hypothetical protein
VTFVGVAPDLIVDVQLRLPFAVLLVQSAQILYTLGCLQWPVLLDKILTHQLYMDKNFAASQKFLLPGQHNRYGFEWIRFQCVQYFCHFVAIHTCQCLQGGQIGFGCIRYKYCPALNASGWKGIMHNGQCTRLYVLTFLGNATDRPPKLSPSRVRLRSSLLMASSRFCTHVSVCTSARLVSNT